MNIENNNIKKESGFETEKIEPIFFRSRQPSRRLRSYTIFKWLSGILFGGILVLLCMSGWFVFTAKQVVIKLEPVPDSIKISGGMLTPRIGNYYLMRPGDYTLEAIKGCFFPFKYLFQVNADKRQVLTLKMRKLPGLLSIHAHQSGNPASKIIGARVYVDDSEVGNTPLENVEIKPGLSRLEIRARDYQDFQTDIEVLGCNELQAVNSALLPGWSNITVDTVPRGAAVMIDGQAFGKTPVQIQLAAGTYMMEISADQYKTWKHRLIVQPNTPQEIKNLQLQPADGELAIRTKPSGASITIGGAFIGQTPLVARLSPSEAHMVQISKAGYEKVTRKVRIPSAMSEQLNVNLAPREGVIHLRVEPVDAELLLDGKSWGVVPKQLRLIAVEHTLEFRKKGYLSHRDQITPRPGFPQQLKITLKRETATIKGAPAEITTQMDYRLKLIQPASFTMGSSRREQGRRSNETLRKIKLTRLFYMGAREITNKEFKEFMAPHKSGDFKFMKLDVDDYPVVRVTWEQAAMYCNWLSAKASLPPAYIKKGDKWVAVEPLNTGFRLPTEAEWEYCARYDSQKTMFKYPWGHQFPPGEPSGNYSDQSAKDLLPTVLEGYNDGYAVTAPSARFKPNRFGLYDMGGNVSEWCHDYYTIYSYAPGKAYVDPVGPKEGKHHVIRGSSWKHGSISTLRLTYRGYGDSESDDVGFRICRYLK